MPSHHTPRRRTFVVTVEMAADFTRTLWIAAPTAEAAAERVSQLAGIGPGDFIQSIRQL